MESTVEAIRLLSRAVELGRRALDLNPISSPWYFSAVGRAESDRQADLSAGLAAEAAAIAELLAASDALLHELG